MLILTVWAFLLASVHSMPQIYQFDHNNQNLQVQPQDILHVTTFNVSMRDDASQRKIEENTKEILEKIEALNKKQGLTKKKKPSYFQFPFSYSRSQEDSRNTNNNFRFPTESPPVPQYQQNQESFVEGRTSTTNTEDENIFKFPTNPFQNPIFQYLEHQQQTLPNQLKTASVPLPSGGTTIVETNPNAEITEDDIIPGQYIKRKITHHQTVIIPSVQTYMNNPYNPAFQQYNMPNQGYETLNPSGLINQYITNNPVGNKKEPNKKQNNKVSSLEKQTVNNIKNIIYNSQPYPSYINPYTFNTAPNYLPYYGMPQMVQNQQVRNGNNQPEAFLYGPYIVPNLDSASLSRQFPPFQSPLQNYFPLVIKDPLVQLFNAFTSMVEYGPQAAGSADIGCKEGNKKSDTETKRKSEEIHKTLKEDSETQEESGEFSDKNEALGETGSVTKSAETNSSQSANIIKDVLAEINEQEPEVKVLTSRSPKGKKPEKIPSVEGPDPQENLKLNKIVSNFNIKENNVNLEQPHYVRIGPRPYNTKEPTTTTPKIALASNILRRGNSPPRRDQILYDDELEEEKKFGFGSSPTPYGSSGSEDIQVSHDANKKLFSKDNTGSGIFIHKLKVRRGGVAIAGPGGIATAGEGGTAIVGPNGYAYTQPDSLAIAGTGTKVIAVEPTVNLSDLVKNKKSRLDDPNSERIGKVVAVGPVIYYNKG